MLVDYFLIMKLTESVLHIEKTLCVYMNSIPILIWIKFYLCGRNELYLLLLLIRPALKLKSVQVYIPFLRLLTTIINFTEKLCVLISHKFLYHITENVWFLFSTYIYFVHQQKYHHHMVKFNYTKSLLTVNTRGRINVKSMLDEIY